MNAQALRFRAIREDRPGEKWAAEFRRTWPSYRQWFLSEGNAARPDLASCRSKLREHMPELEPTWDRLVELSGEGEVAARMLSLYRPAPYLSGCSLAVWLRDKPLLVRNYDYRPDACEGTFLRSKWTGPPVLASIDCLWGALDGINAHGLCVALAFGGRYGTGEGFGIPLILRYVLELCRTVEEAKEVLVRIPSHMAYNVSMVDSSGDHAVVFLAPDRAPMVLLRTVAANHQDPLESTDPGELASSVERARLLTERLQDPALDPESFIEGFLRPPVFNTGYAQAVGTLYTAVYDSQGRLAEYRWPQHRWRLSLDEFVEGELLVEYPAAG